MKRSLVIACTLLAALFSSTARADVPELLSYQGVLTDASGTALADGPYNVTFRLYTSDVGGSAIWTEAHLVTVSKGIFSANLGWTQVLSSLDFDLPYYLGVSVEGGAELTPRTLLTDAAYAMNARMVKGSAATANKIPATGNVGIGTTNPSIPLQVASDDQIGIQYNGSDLDWASIYVSATQDGAAPGFGYLQSGVMRAHTYVNANREWCVRVGSTVRLRVSPMGWVCVGSSSPDEQLEVEGGILLGNSLNLNAGTMRFTGTDFQGFDGSLWKSFTATGGGGGLPTGISGQTLRHDGMNWVATSSIYNSDVNVGIGTTTPDARVSILGTNTQDVKIETSTASGLTSLTLKTAGGASDRFSLYKNGPTAVGTVDGIPLANLSRVTTETNAGPLMLQIMTANPIHFVTNNLERMRLDANGNLGINTKSPGAKLHVDGNQWDLTNTEGDFKIGNASYRLKFGVATGGGGAGTAGIRVAGGAQKLILGGGTAEVLSVDGAGNTNIGGPTSNAKLRLYRAGVDSAMVYAYTTLNGGVLFLNDEADNPTVSLQGDPNGTGGYFDVQRDVGLSGFKVDGNYLGSTNPYVYIFGAYGSYFNAGAAGTASVSLPTNAIGSVEMLDEPGVASYSEGVSIVSLAAGWTTLGSQTIVAPAAGYVLVIGTAQATTSHTNGTASSFEFGVSENAAALPDNQDLRLRLDPVLPTGGYQFPVTFHGLFQVAGAGSHTYYFIGRENSGDGTAEEVQLTCLYIPTAYGTFDPMLTRSNAPGGDSAPERPAIDMVAQWAASEGANNDRIARELAALRAEVEALKQAARDE